MSAFSWVLVLPGRPFTLGLSLLEPDAEQDLDWTVAGNYSKTVTDLRRLILGFLFGEGFSSSLDEIYTEPSSVLAQSALKENTAALPCPFSNLV